METMSTRALVVLIVASLAAMQAHGRELSPHVEIVSNDTVVVGNGGLCEYKVIIKTEASLWAGTASKITFGFYDKNSQGFTVDHTGFPSGIEHTIHTIATCIHPCYLYVGTDCAGPHPDWKCHTIKVVGNGGEKMYSLNRWFGPGKNSITNLHLNECFGAANAVSSS